VEHTAVIDMGSNSWRLVVYAYERGSWWRLSDEVREAVRVGERLGEELTLKPEPMERALHTAAVFAAFLRAGGVEDVVCVATSAIRDARNRDELLGAIREQTGLEVRVLSGEEEAWYGYLAIANSTTVEQGFGLDVGGGSIQALAIEDRRLARTVSLPLGAVRVTESFLPGDEASGKQVTALRKHARRELEGLGWLGGGDAPRLAGIGGTIRNLATAAQKRSDHPDTGVQGYVLTRDALEELVDELASRPARKRAGMPGIKLDRADVILGGAVVVAAALEAGGFDGIEVTRAGLREGVFLERLNRDRDPPLTPDVRRDSVERLAAHFRGSDTRHDHHVAHLSLEVYDGLAAAGLIEADAGDRELLWAACRLHDIGVAIDYDDHHKHSRYLILSAGLPGFTPRELMLVALVARYHRKGDPDPSELGSIARKGDDARLSLLAGVLRLAEQLERSRDGQVRSVRVGSQNGRVLLAADAAGDPTVPLWAARRNAGLLAEALGRDVEVERA
jgi:exopolyphosphatase/guanosine-5'-triphosphate,3'-diphosphate pyrophosphatase